MDKAFIKQVLKCIAKVSKSKEIFKDKIKNQYKLLIFIIQYDIIVLQMNVIGGDFMSTSIVQFRIDDELKAKATEIYENLGIDLSTAMRMFLKRTVSVNGIPFSMVLPREAYNAQLALDSMYAMNHAAKENNISDMSLDDINAEIAAYRKERREKAGI